jgi:hypothetical protein
LETGVPTIHPELLRALAMLLDEALDLEAVARSAWLARVGATDPILAEEVRRLFEAEAVLDARHFLKLGVAGARGSSAFDEPAGGR